MQIKNQKQNKILASCQAIDVKFMKTKYQNLILSQLGPEFQHVTSEESVGGGGGDFLTWTVGFTY